MVFDCQKSTLYSEQLKQCASRGSHAWTFLFESGTSFRNEDTASGHWLRLHLQCSEAWNCTNYFTQSASGELVEGVPVF